MIEELSLICHRIRLKFYLMVIIPINLSILEYLWVIIPLKQDLLDSRVYPVTLMKEMVVVVLLLLLYR